MNRLQKKRDQIAFFLSARRFFGRRFFFAVCIVFLVGYVMLVQIVLQRLQVIMTERIDSSIENIRTGLEGTTDKAKLHEKILATITPGDMQTVVLDSALTPIAWAHLDHGFFSSKTVSTYDTSHDAREYVRNHATFLQTATPKVIYYPGTTTTYGYIVFGTSKAAASLTALSVTMAFVFMAFILFMSVSLHTVRLHERSSLWVALAKETAHQLGTPISALMGWVE